MVFGGAVLGNPADSHRESGGHDGSLAEPRPARASLLPVGITVAGF